MKILGWFGWRRTPERWERAVSDYLAERERRVRDIEDVIRREVVGDEYP